MESPDYKIVTTPLSKLDEFIQLRTEALSNEPLAYVASVYDSDFMNNDGQEILQLRSRADFRLSLEVEDRIVGMICSSKSHHNLSNATIHFFYLTPKYRGMGLGLALMKKLVSSLDSINEVKYLEVFVASSQKAAVHICGSTGFQSVGVANCNLINVPKKRCDVLIMKRPNLLYLEQMKNVPTPSTATAMA